MLYILQYVSVHCQRGGILLGGKKLGKRGKKRIENWEEGRGGTEIGGKIQGERQRRREKEHRVGAEGR